MADSEACQCDQDGEWWACINGALYGPCEDENCGGMCEYKGDCDHSCHRPKSPRRDPRDHAFRRSADPEFGVAFGGGCVERVDCGTHGWVACGWPESVHPAGDTAPNPGGGS